MRMDGRRIYWGRNLNLIKIMQTICAIAESENDGINFFRSLSKKKKYFPRTTSLLATYLCLRRLVLVKLYTLQLFQMCWTVVSHPLHSVAYLTYQQKVFDLISSVFRYSYTSRKRCSGEGEKMEVDGMFEVFIRDDIMYDLCFVSRHRIHGGCWGESITFSGCLIGFPKLNIK